MENLESIAIAIQYSYSDQLDQTVTNQELRDAAVNFTQTEFPSLDQTKLNSIADLIVDLYDVVEQMIDLPRISPQYPKCDLSDCQIALVGEAPGRDEVPAGIPFVGRAGQLLNELLQEVGIDRSLCYVTNVFLYQPPDNKVAHFFTSRMAAKLKDVEICDDLPSYNNTYLRKEFLPELARLSDEITQVNPRVTITLGSTAMWAFTGAKSITQEHGTVYESHLVPNMCVIPTFHPAYILRNISQKDKMIQDLSLAKSLAE